ncbi:MAG: hypothetical protein HDR88_17875 [Bacteroides sp.]|nr:hypothetical protein [Bacteroides sp.]
MKLKTLILFMLLPLLGIAAPKYYGKHIVLVVDQTPKTSSGGFLQPIGDDLKSFLFGETPKTLNSGPKDFSFDPTKDYLEVFLYGLEGSILFPNPNGNAFKLLRQSVEQINNDSLFTHTLNYLVHPYENYTGEGDFEKTWDNVFSNAFDTRKTSVGKSISQDSGYGLSGFLPNTVIPFINKSIPAQEYYVICVSTYQTGYSGQPASYDINILGQIYDNLDKAKIFYKWLKQYSAPYQISDWVEISRGVHNDKGVTATGRQLIMQSAVNTSVNITSNINLSQKSYLGDSFEINKLTVSFPKDDRLNIKDVYLTVTTDKGSVVYDELQSFKYDDVKKEFVIDAQTINLNSFSKDEVLDFQLTFMPESNNSDILPYVFLANRAIPASEISYKPAPTYLYILISVLVIVLGFIDYLIYLSRGKKATSKIDIDILPISNEKFMDVSNNHVISQDCWYFQERRRSKNIAVKGSIKTIIPKFAKPYKLIAEYEIEDVDLNEDFSFRPAGTEHNGSQRSAKKWYPLHLDNNGNYSFEVTAYLEDTILYPDFSDLTHCILRLKVNIRTYFADHTGKQITPYTQDESRYRFIVRPAIPNSDLWIALDPGTTGSCIAYGWGGLPADTDNINLACNISKDTAGNNMKSPIFYSKIQILNHASIFDGGNPAEMQVFDSEKGKGDFRFGNEAHIYWGKNSFQSIKKLLGYANEFKVKNNNGVVARISGHDLAHLLVKGLCSEFEKYIATSKTVPDTVRQKLLTDGHLSPSRAIVAVPNNYTVNKVQAMVDSIKRTKLFKEVHYLYEAEGVLMYYLNLNWANLPKMANKTFIVFDMGGATINATAFKINVKTNTNKGHAYTQHITVNTVSRVGYTVGGDNIDYALIKIIIGIPSFKERRKALRISENELLRENKKRLITFVQKLKVDYVDKKAGNTREGNIAESKEALWIEIFKLANDCGISVPDSMSDKDLEYLNDGKAAHKMYELVINSVEDSVKELVSGITISDVELILSGRSVLYPRIKKTVRDTLKKYKFNVNPWNYKGGIDSDQDVVKTAVVRGACWYGMFSKYINLRHDIVTSTFGYTDTVDGTTKFIPVVSKNTNFNDNGEAEGEVEPIDPTTINVKFLQMLGSDYDEILKNKIHHKKAELTQVYSSEISGSVKSIKVKIDSNGNFSYEINVLGESVPLTGTCNTIDVDITDTNSEAYAFAAMATLDDNTVSSQYDPINSPQTTKINISKTGDNENSNPKRFK